MGGGRRELTTGYLTYSIVEVLLPSARLAVIPNLSRSESML